MKATTSDSSNSGTKVVKEEEDVALASKGQHQQHQRKKDVSKIKGFKCGEMGHYITQCPLRKTDQEEKQDQQAASVDIDRLSSRLDKEFAMIVEKPPRVRWGDL